MVQDLSGGVKIIAPATGWARFNARLRWTSTGALYHRSPENRWGAYNIDGLALSHSRLKVHVLMWRMPLQSKPSYPHSRHLQYRRTASPKTTARRPGKPSCKLFLQKPFFQPMPRIEQDLVADLRL